MPHFVSEINSNNNAHRKCGRYFCPLKRIRKDNAMKKYTKIICMVATVCLLGAAAFCGFRIYSHYAHESKQEEVFEKIAEVVEQAQTDRCL